MQNLTTADPIDTLEQLHRDLPFAALAAWLAGGQHVPFERFAFVVADDVRNDGADSVLAFLLGGA